MKPGYTSLILASLLGMMSSASTAEEIGQTIGEAHDLKSDELLYRETHCVNDDQNARRVIYRNSGDELIAHKTLDYESGRMTPSFVQQNFYSNEKIMVSLQQDELRMVILEEGNPEPKKSVTAQPDARIPVVIDAGFDVFVLDNWERLVAGDRLRFQFPFASRSSLIELQIKPAACSYTTDRDQCFELEMGNWFFRMLVDPIELGYDAEMKRLTRYRGLSNIGDGKGEGLVVDIRYRYQDIPASACSVKELGLTETLNRLQQPQSQDS